MASSTCGTDCCIFEWALNWLRGGLWLLLLAAFWLCHMQLRITPWPKKRHLELTSLHSLASRCEGKFVHIVSSTRGTRGEYSAKNTKQGWGQTSQSDGQHSKVEDRHSKVVDRNPKVEDKNDKLKDKRPICFLIFFQKCPKLQAFLAKKCRYIYPCVALLLLCDFSTVSNSVVQQQHCV